MQISQWFRPPRHLWMLFFTAALVPTIALAWLGWRLVEQDRDLERQRIQERLDHAADLIGAQLRQALSEIEEQLAVLAALPSSQMNQRTAQYAEALGDNTLIVVLHARGIDVYPRDHLLYYPYIPPPKEPAGSIFAAGELLEFREQNYAGAILTFRKLANSENLQTRAGALLRLGRNLRKAGRMEEALTIYHELAELGSITLGGLPAELVARLARCILLDELQQSSALRQEAESLYGDLNSSRWRISRAVYRFHAEEVQRWLNSDQGDGAEGAISQSDKLALASAVESTWEEWQRIKGGESQMSGRRSHWIQDRSVLTLWRGTTARVVALVAAMRHLESCGMANFRDAVNPPGLNVTLADAEGHVVLGQLAPAGTQQALRTTAETKLPWTIHVASVDPQVEIASTAGRRRLLFAGLAMMAVLILTGSYFIARAFSREMAVARLQTDFVAAVSHEFRTPLTTMRQLTEMLARGRIPSEERRQRYYDVLAHETGRLHRLVEGLLNFGRMEAGAQEYRFEELDAVMLVRGVVTDFQREAESTGYRIELQTHGICAAMKADKEALERALWNLLDNAVKYSPDSKTIWVEVARDSIELVLRVRDRGVGMAAKELKEIFKKFVRGEAAKSTSIKGTGIGLSMVHRIVEAHGGRVRVESEPGRGSTFTIVLPLEG